MREQFHIVKNPHYRKFKKHPKGHCKCCGKFPLPPLKRLYCSNKCRNEYWRCSNKEVKEFWSDFRERMIRRDNYTCLACGYTQNNKRATTDRDWKDQRTLALHHIIPISKGGAMWDEDNVETLCAEKCHKFKHRMRALEPTLDSKQTELKDFEKNNNTSHRNERR